MALWVEDSELSLLWCVFDPWLGNFCMPWVWPKKKKKKKNKYAKKWKNIKVIT